MKQPTTTTQETLGIYVTEPEVVDLDIVRSRIQGTNYRLILGNPTYTKNHQSHIDTLLVRSGTTVDRTIRDVFPNLKHVIRIGTGLDSIDLDFCHTHEVAVYHSPGANAGAVSDYVVGMMLLALRNIHRLTPQAIRNWDRFAFVGRNLSEQTVGLVGFGNIGKQVLRKLEGFKPDIRIFDPYVTPAAAHQQYFVTLATLLQESDIIVLLLPLTAESRHILSAKNLGLIKDKAIIINAARGGIVDEQAILNMPATKHFTYIADAVEHEPDVNPALLEDERIILTPHIAGLTDHSEAAMIHLALDNFLQNRPYNHAHSMYNGNA